MALPLLRSFSRRYAGLRRDAAMVAGGLLGRTPPPLVDRPRRRADRDTAAAARVLRVAEVVRETEDAVSLWLEDPAGAPVAFEPGQFLTLVTRVGGRSLRRAYSLSSDHRAPQRVRITIKRVAGGRVSNHVNDTARAGDRVRVLGPSGDFTCVPDHARRRHVVLVGGGSGITPLMAIATAVLAGEPGSDVSLVLGNRSARDVIFAGELGDLQRDAGDRFAVEHVYGLLDAETLAARLDGFAGRDRGREVLYYVCGPEPMMAIARDVLAARGVDPASIREERFSSPHLRADAAIATTPQDVTVRAGGARYDVRTAPGQTILDAALAAGAPMEFSCAMGGCGACKVRLASGTVIMEEPNCLTDAEKEDGAVLACVARPSTPCVVEASGEAA